MTAVTPMSNIRRSSAPTLMLAAGEVEVWRIRLEGSEDPECLSRCLSLEELMRAARFAFAADKQHFMARRAALRRILSAYLGAEPGELHFVRDANGRPHLASQAPDGLLDFSLTHSGGWALLAVGRNLRLGLDLESLRPFDEVAPVARHFFSPSERDSLADLPGDERARAFFRGWTGKEAVLKALGKGLNLPADKIEISLAPEAPSRLLSLEGSSQAAAAWRLDLLGTGFGAVASLAVHAVDFSLRYRDYSRCFVKMRGTAIT